MRNRKNKILLAAVCVCLLAVTAFGTLAYFTAQNTAENTFMVASSDNPKDPLFAIEVTESVPDNQDVSENDVGGYTYHNITPGDTRTKNPTITNIGQYEQWVRVKVTLSNAADWEDALGNDIYNLATITVREDGVAGVQDGWSLAGTGAVKESDELVWTYYLGSKLAPKGSAKLFEKVQIPSGLETEDMVNLNGFTLTVEAQAIQSKNTADNAVDAFVFYDNPENPSTPEIPETPEETP